MTLSESCVDIMTSRNLKNNQERLRATFLDPVIKIKMLLTSKGFETQTYVKGSLRR